MSPATVTKLQIYRLFLLATPSSEGMRVSVIEGGVAVGVLS